LKKRVPKGTSEYQAAWIVSDDEDNNSNTQDQVDICISTNTLYLIILGF